MLQFHHEDARFVSFLCLLIRCMLQVKESDCFSAVNNATLDFALSYMFFMTSNNFPEIPEFSIFDHNVDLFIMFIVSNAFL